MACGRRFSGMVHEALLVRRQGGLADAGVGNQL